MKSNFEMFLLIILQTPFLNFSRFAGYKTESEERLSGVQLVGYR